MIQTDFFRSKHFVIAAVVAVGIVAAAAGAYAVTGDVVGSGERACDAPSVAGRDVTPSPAVATEADGERRSETYAFDAGSLAAGSLELCVSVGEVLVERSAGTQVEIAFTISSPARDAVERTSVAAKLTDDAGRLRVAAWEAVRGEAPRAFAGDRSADVRLVVRVPESGAWDVRAENDVGDVRVTELRVGELDLATDVGDVIVTSVDLERDANARTDVGDVLLSFASVQSGNLTASADVGEVELQLPQRADVGYDATASTDVGAITMRLGDVEATTSEEDGAGEREHQRTTGFSSKPTRVTVSATTSVGDIRVVAAAPAS